MVSIAPTVKEGQRECPLKEIKGKEINVFCIFVNDSQLVIMNKTQLVILFIAFLITSCTKPSEYNSSVEPDGKDNVQEKVEYYVRYCFDSSTGRFDISYTDVDGKGIYLSNVVAGPNFERTVGPVEKGFTASLYVKSTTGGDQFNGRIEIKKGEAPFVVKKEGNTYYTIKYTIDF